MDIQPKTDQLTELALLTLYDFPRKLDTYLQVLTYAQQPPVPNEPAPLTFNMSIPVGITNQIKFGDQEVIYPPEVYNQGLNIENGKDKFELTLERSQMMVDRIFEAVDNIDQSILVYQDFDIDNLRQQEKDVENELQKEIENLKVAISKVDGKMRQMELEKWG
ncbi:hypothetical protein SS50377_23834 [Spironucleus salmonicida]|uniref:Uncharacterized protein n=1 Tax=Spironucleus salmonicida TaxID=348837 RepID=V6LK70_9EUKA|nr:hypothetical protein SS50377_23834 [Spironucleus salmonicida]|eukprot:EST44136.1 Hypothetical protein SS50377_16037 [Spironucleus salmonicida]